MDFAGRNFKHWVLGRSQETPSESRAAFEQKGQTQNRKYDMQKREGLHPLASEGVGIRTEKTAQVYAEREVHLEGFAGHGCHLQGALGKKVEMRFRA